MLPLKNTKYILLSGLLFITLNAITQDCTKELLQQKPGTWKAGQQGFVQNVSAADLTKEKAIIKNIHKMVSTHYSPMGCQISYSALYGKHLSAAGNWIADRRNNQSFIS